MLARRENALALMQEIGEPIPAFALVAHLREDPAKVGARLRESGFLTWTGYREWRDAWEKHVATLPPRKGGFATPPDKPLGRVGRPFAQLVLEALDANRVTSVEAARFLDLRFEHFGRLREMMAQGPGGGAADE